MINDTYRKWYFEDDDVTKYSPEKMLENKQYEKIEEYVEENYCRLHQVMLDSGLSENESLWYLQYGHSIQDSVEDLLKTDEQKAIYELGKLSGMVTIVGNLCMNARFEKRKENSTNYWKELRSFSNKQKSFRCSFCGGISKNATEECPDCKAKMYFTWLYR